MTMNLTNAASRLEVSYSDAGKLKTCSKTFPAVMLEPEMVEAPGVAGGHVPLTKTVGALGQWNMVHLRS
jgi:hypothetical protein